MTSKHCFFKVMKEDFRHKTWMLALSILGNLLALPVAFMMSTGNGVIYDGTVVTVEKLTRQVNGIEEFFLRTMCISGGIIAIAGAFIVGMFGFRYVFHRNMVDTYHSMPVRRRTLFAAGWLNGLLIWLLPFLANLTVTVIIGESRLSTLRRTAAAIPALSTADREIIGNWLTGGGLVKNALLSTLALVIAFLLMYHLVLLAVMLCGNVLNTLVATAVTGAGVISVYGMVFMFQVFYLDTFLSAANDYFDKVAYASPLVSSVYVLYRRMEDMQTLQYSSLAMVLVLNLLIAAMLGILALTAYLKRPSELAEQGIVWKPVKFTFQTVTSVLAAMGGWLLFQNLARAVMGETGAYAWGIFGAMLAGIVVFGVLDIIFHMDFKAFFRHKIVMAAVMGVSLLICFAFSLDWMGYDSYLPEKEDIAEIALYDYNCGNGNFYYLDLEDDRHPLNSMHITNREAAYNFLVEAVDYEENEKTYYCDNVDVKVTLESGRCYYRSYIINEHNADSLYALLTSPEYMGVMFGLSDSDDEAVSNMYVNRNNMNQVVLRAVSDEDREIMDTICRAYNKDIAENPEAVVSGSGRMLCTIVLRTEGGHSHSRYLEVNEEMTNTIEAMRELNFGEYVEPVSAEEVQEIVLNTYYRYADLYEGINLVELVCQIYEVFPEGLDVNSYAYDDLVLSAEDDYKQTIETGDSHENEYIALHITEKSEVEELLRLISYTDARGIGVFRPGYVGNVTIVMKDGKQYDVYITYGALPEKYILRFAELQEELLQREN